MKLPKLGPLGASFSDDVVMPPAPGDPNPGLLRSPTAFGDDIPAGRRLAVRVRLTAEDGMLHFDYSDSDPVPEVGPPFSLGEGRVAQATLAAINVVLDQPVATIPESPLCFETTDSASWIGRGDAEDDMLVAFGMARVFDVALGAMANAWPSKVGAGSTSLGAIVDFRSDGQSVRDIVEGGEGATPRRHGASAWLGPMHAMHRGEAEWLTAEQRVREKAGGIGARHGGSGVRRTYAVTRDATVIVGIDRITNPPHGIDRAGPPQPAGLWIALPGEPPRRVAAWVEHEVPAGSRVVLETAGGAGHGFPGWGVDWDPDAF